MKRLAVLCAAIAAAAFALSRPVQADLLRYDVSGPATFSFYLDSNPAATPDATFPDSFYLTGVANTAGKPFPYLYFFDLGIGGAFAASSKPDASGDIVSFFGDQLFTDSSKTPTLLTGTFQLYSAFGDPETPDTTLAL